LASKLTGWKIDIKSESKMEKISSEILEGFKNLPYMGDVHARVLYNEGFRSIKEVGEVDPEELAKALGFEKEKAAEIVEAAQRMTRQEEAAKEAPPEELATSEAPAPGPLDQIEGVGEKTAEILKTHGLKTVQDILKADVESLSALPGIGVKKAEKLIQAAQRYAEGTGNE
jgi:N utilization substance protein A